MHVNKQTFSGPLVAALLCTAFTGAFAQNLSVDEIVGRFISAIGGPVRIRSIENLVYMNGIYEEGDYSGDGTAAMSLARPWFKLVGDKNNPGTYMEGYDGAAWEWFADPGVVIRTVGPASAAIRHYAGVEHPLFNYQDKGSVAQLLQDSEFDDRPVFVVRLTRRDGFAEYFYIDKETFLVNASGSEAPIHAFGEDVARITRISDYRDVGGVLVAHRFESAEVPSGRTLSSMQWGAIEANRPLPDGWFSPPDFVRTPLQHFMESLYGQRSDPSAVMWTYEEFIRANPDVDTSEAVNTAAFQALKMGDVDIAIALLERNVSAYPQSASARFGLGRALESAGNRLAAVEAYRAARAIDPDDERAGRALELLEAPVPESW